MRPAPSKKTAAGNGTAVKLLNEPTTLSPLAKTSRHSLFANEPTSGGVVGRARLLKVFPPGSLSDTKKLAGNVPPIGDAPVALENAVILSVPPAGGLLTIKIPLDPEAYEAL